MNLAYRILFYLARAIALGPTVQEISFFTWLSRLERNFAHVRPLYGHDAQGDPMQSLGGPGDGTTPMRGTRWGRRSTGRSDGEPERGDARGV